MNKPLAYLRESIANYTEKYDLAQHLYDKLAYENFTNEKAFVDSLNQEEIMFLEKILPQEIYYSKGEQDELRTTNLTKMYEVIY